MRCSRHINDVTALRKDATTHRHIAEAMLHWEGHTNECLRCQALLEDVTTEDIIDFLIWGKPTASQPALRASLTHQFGRIASNRAQLRYYELCAYTWKRCVELKQPVAAATATVINFPVRPRAAAPRPAGDHTAAAVTLARFSR